MSSVRADVLVFSPPHKNERKIVSSEFLLLKPFSKTPGLQIAISEPGKSKATLLSVQNIDDTSSRVYFEIPANKSIIIKPESLIIGPQSVEIFEVIAVEVKESFRASIKIFAPDIPFYRGGQFSVAVQVKQPTKVEPKKRPKPVTSVVKSKAVTLPREFAFQKSRKERREANEIAKLTPAKNTTVEVTAVPNLQPINETFNLEDLRRQTHLIKKAIDINQTFVVPSHKSSVSKDPVTFVRTILENDRDSNVRSAVSAYLDFAVSQNLPLPPRDELKQKHINRLLTQLLPEIEAGNLSFAIQQLRNIENSPAIELSETTGHEKFQNKFNQIREAHARRSSKVTSSPKHGTPVEIEGDNLETPEKLAGLSQRTLQEMVSNYLTIDESNRIENSLNIESPNVSAIYPLDS